MTLQASFTVDTPTRAKKEKLFHSDKIEIRKSPLHGYGIFAKDDITKGELLEECYYLEVGWGGEVDRYYYELLIDKNSNKNVISLGFGSMYNSSPDKKENASMEWDLNNDILIFKSIKDIKKDKEILLEYDLGFKSDKKI
jgi:SET domain-containing protein